MADASWIVERPVAHRGLHDASAGILENTASAFQAAVAAGYATECDVQISSDGEAMVFHDKSLDRLMDRSGRVDAFTASALREVPMKGGRDRMITLGELCDLVAGRAPIIVEVKPSWSNDRQLEGRVAEVLKRYTGQVAVMSFDPGSTATFRTLAPGIPRGVVQESVYDGEEWRNLTVWKKYALGRLLHLPYSRPHFLAWYVKDLEFRAPQLARRLFGMPVLAWTIRTPGDQARAAIFADQMIFEGFRA
jgi:glycerophosphoryl diester phosphodiesterase